MGAAGSGLMCGKSGGKGLVDRMGGGGYRSIYGGVRLNIGSRRVWKSCIFE